MNVPANRGAGALAALGGLKKNLQNVVSTISTPGGDYLLRMVTGTWVYGAENVEVEDKSEWAVNPLSLTHGFVAWTDYKKKKNEIMGEVMVPLTQSLPMLSDLREHVDSEGNVCEWRQAIGIQLQCMTGADKGEQVHYKPTSVGGLNALRELINDIVGALDEDPDHPVPVVTLDVDSYQHKQYGKTFVPVLTIVDWIPLDGEIKEPLKEPEQETAKEPEKPAEATRQRTRRAEPEQTRAASDTEISEADRRAAINASMAELTQEQAAETGRQAAASEEAPGRVRRRR